jgi:hypothetical protein
LTRVSGASTSSPSTARVVDGLLSFAAVDGTGATGLDAVSLGPTSIAGIMTWAPPIITLPASVAAQNGKLVDFSSAGIRTIADIASFSLANPLPGHEPDSGPYGVLVRAGRTFVADAANNTLLQVSGSSISTLATFEFTPQDEFDGVPTSIAWHNGNLYVGQLSSFVPGAANVTVFDLSGSVVRTIGGLTSVTAVAVANNGDVYATEIFTGEPFASPGALVKIPADGSARTTTPLPTPGGVTLDGNGNVYVSINSVSPTDGAIIRMPA